MGKASRARAEALFNADIVTDRYLRVLGAAATRQHLEIEHWPRGDLSASLAVREAGNRDR
jgi:hypothetical protein